MICSPRVICLSLSLVTGDKGSVVWDDHGSRASFDILLACISSSGRMLGVSSSSGNLALTVSQKRTVIASVSNVANVPLRQLENSMPLMAFEPRGLLPSATASRSVNVRRGEENRLQSQIRTAASSPKDAMRFGSNGSTDIPWTDLVAVDSGLVDEKLERKSNNLSHLWLTPATSRLVVSGRKARDVTVSVCDHCCKLVLSPRTESGKNGSGRLKVP